MPSSTLMYVLVFNAVMILIAFVVVALAKRKSRKEIKRFRLVKPSKAGYHSPQAKPYKASAGDIL